MRTQISREYSRLFGAPPLRGIARLRNAGQPRTNLLQDAVREPAP